MLRLTSHVVKPELGHAERLNSSFGQNGRKPNDQHLQRLHGQRHSLLDAADLRASFSRPMAAQTPR